MVVSGVFLSISLRNDGVVQEPKVCLVQNGDSKSAGEEEEDEEEEVVEADNAVMEGREKRKIRVRARGVIAMNTTKHLWAGAIAAMVSRSVLLLSFGNKIIYFLF